MDLDASGFSFISAIYYHRPIIKHVRDIVEWYHSQLNLNVLIVGNIKLPRIDWATMNLRQNRDHSMHNSFIEFIEYNDLHQHVALPTHIKGNTLDLVISNLIIYNPMGEHSCSDHDAITCSVDINRHIV